MTRLHEHIQNELHTIGMKIQGIGLQSHHCQPESLLDREEEALRIGPGLILEDLGRQLKALSECLDHIYAEALLQEIEIGGGDEGWPAILKIQAFVKAWRVRP